MSTHSTIKFIKEFSDTPVLSVYIQFDGYISGVGHELAEWLKSKKMVNGFTLTHTSQNGYANGMGCLAAQYLANFKTGIGGVYTTTPDDCQEYNYEVRYIDNQFIISVDNFKGTPEELLNYKERK